MTYCYAVKNGMINNKVNMTEQELIVKYTNEDDGTINEKVTGELIRCKKCKHRYKDGFGSGYICTYHVCSFGVKDDDFCSKGELKGQNG